MGNTVRKTLLSNASATGSAATWPGGAGFFQAEGTFDGASVDLQIQTPNGTWVDVGGETRITANGMGFFYAPAGQVRAAVSGGTSPTALYAYIMRL